MTQRGTSEANQPNWRPDQGSFALRTGKVIAVNPASHTVDLALAGGGIVYGAAVMEMWAGSDYGDLWTPQFRPDPGVSPRGLPAEAWKVNPQRRRDAYAVVAFFDGSTSRALVLGFFYPEISAMMFDAVQRLTRYVGDSFSAVSLDGSQWLAFDQDGGYVGFHTRQERRPPDLTRQDYDHQTDTAPGIHHFTVMLANGATVGLDGESGNITIGTHAGIETIAGRNLDLLGAPLTLHGAEDFYLVDPALAPFGGLCRAPSSTGDGGLVVNITVNAAYGRRLPLRQRPALNETSWQGWRRLKDGTAGRMEVGADGVVRHFAAPTGLAGSAIVWADAPAHYAPFFVQQFFAGVGIARVLIPPVSFAVTGIASDNVGGVQVRANGAAINPSPAAPVVIAGPQVIEIETTSVGVGGGNVAIYGNHG